MYLAHSGELEKNIPTQPYKEHILNVREKSLKEVKKILSYYNYGKDTEKLKISIKNAVERACLRHDMGKLDKITQQVFRGEKNCKFINHVDSGVAYCLNNFNTETGFLVEYLVSALLIDAHHIGLENTNLENLDSLRDNSKIIDKYPDYEKYLINKEETVAQYVNRFLKKWDKIHQTEIGIENFLPQEAKYDLEEQTLLLRFLLSCLVEGDYWDTARHYRNFVSYSNFELKPKKRLEKLIEVVNSLAEGKTPKERKRNKIRNEIFKESIKLGQTNNCSFFSNEAYPGNGKTYASMAMALIFAMRYNLRRIIYIAPYKRILQQNAKEIKKGVVLEEEKDSEIVAEHHHEADYFTKAGEENVPYSLLKIYSTNWESLFILTTAVQFCESLASRKPMKLRKLHNIPGSVIIIDEFHDFVPVEYRRQMAKWLKQLVENWGCKVIFLSGSMIKCWELEDLKPSDIEVKQVIPKKIMKLMNRLEKNRIKYIKINKPLTVSQLINKIFSVRGPRLVITNTVHSAAMIANEIRNKYDRKKVEHLSLALSPKDRAKVMEEIEKRLKNKKDKDWVLIATSCIENGVNFSFVHAFRERRSLMSIIQPGGRTNRNGEYRGPCHVYDFVFAKSEYDREAVTDNPADKISSKILEQLWEENKIHADYCTEALQRELKEKNKDEELKKVEEMESKLQYKDVDKNFKIIKTITRAVIVDEELKKRIKIGEKPFYNELMMGSVEVHIESKKFRENIETYEQPNEDDHISSENCFNIWTGYYDPNFLGYMAQILDDKGYSVRELE